MTEDNGKDRSQKTVAELLALHGNSAEGSRRRRRAAERDDESAGSKQPGISDTAPQAIIDRVQAAGDGADGSDSAAHPAAEQDRHAVRHEPSEPGAAPQPEAPPRMSQQQSVRPQQQRPSPPQASPQPTPPQQPHQQASQQPSSQAGQEQSRPQLSPRQPAPQQRQDPAQSRQPSPQPPQTQQQTQQQTPQTQQPPQAPPQRSQQLARPWSGRRGPLRPARRPEPEPSTDQFPALNDAEQDGVSGHGEQAGPQQGPRVPAGAPPAGLARWRKRRQQQQAEETDVGLVPPVPADDGESAESSVERALAGSAEPMSPEGAPTGEFIPSFDTGTQSVTAPETSFDGRMDDDLDGYPAENAEGTVGVEDEYIDDGYIDDYVDGDEGHPGDDYYEHDGDYYEHDDDYYEYDYYEYDYYEYDEEYADHADYDDYDSVRYGDDDGLVREDYQDEDDPESDSLLDSAEDDRSPGRQWLLLAGQLAVGVVAGAGVWLGFSWLWNEFPSAALIAALIAIVGLVWVVRKVRRAEDTQTTVLAVLVGLIVTVSPAALLLVDR